MVKIADLPGPQNFRDKRARKLVKKITEFVRIRTRYDVVDFGSGYGEIPAEMAKNGCLVTCIDLFTLPSKKINKSKVRENIMWISGDVTKKIASLEDNSTDLVTMFYLLQALDENGKKAAIREAIRITKKEGNIVIVDEIPRKFWSFWDVIVHCGLNLVEKSKGYNILESGEYKRLFSEAGLKIKAEGRYGNCVLYVL